MYEILSVHLGSGELGESRRAALSELAEEQNCFWNDEPSIGRLIIKIADERRNAMAKDWVFCPKCGEQYNRFGPGHKCNRRVLAELKKAKKDDKKVREQEGKK